MSWQNWGHNQQVPPGQPFYPAGQQQQQGGPGQPFFPHHHHHMFLQHQQQFGGAQPFYPHHHHHHHHHQQNWNQQPNYNQNFNNNNNQQQRFSAGAAEFVPGGFRPQQQQQQEVPPPQPEEPKTVSAADALNKKTAQVDLTQKTGKAKTISLGFKKKGAEAATATATATTEETTKPKEEVKPESPTTTAPSTENNNKAEEQQQNDDDESSKPSSPTTTTTTTSNAPAAKPSGKKAAAKKVNKLRQKTYVRDPRPHFNVVFTGHVDSGKSTCSGHLLADFGLVEEREMEKLRKEAEANHREGWEYAYVMDLSEEERAKGKTHETGAAYLETEHRRITILDAPGHSAYVGSMIGGAAQADIAVMIISAKTGEFESGFNKGGQTREHAMLCRSCGVRYMIIGVNKMDECNWDKERYDQIIKEIGPHFKQNGFELGKNAIAIPLSGLSGKGLSKTVPKEDCPWWNEGPSIISHINQLQLPASKGEEDELCIPLVGAYKDEFGKVFIYGKIESGSVVIGDELMMLPGNRTFTVDGIQVENTELEKAYPNDNVHIRVKGMEENEVHCGFVVTTPESKLKAVEYIQARIVVLDARNLISAGSKAMLHVHTAAEEVTFHSLLAKLDRKTFEVTEQRPAFVKPGEAVLARLELGIPMVLQEAKEFDKLGRFVLRDQSKTIAIGLVTKLYESTKAAVAKKEGGDASSATANTTTGGSSVAASN